MRLPRSPGRTPRNTTPRASPPHPLPLLWRQVTMKKVILLCSMFLALAASVASAAQGLNLRWTACFGDAGTFNRNFACNVNTGTNQLTGSFELGADLLSASGNEIVVDIATASPTLPAWWAFRAVGSCRQASLTMNTTISAA